MARAIPCQLDRVFAALHQGDGITADNFSRGITAKQQGRSGIGINHHPCLQQSPAAFDSVACRQSQRTAHTFRQGAELVVVLQTTQRYRHD
jgi:hypothetical protein